LLFIYLIIYGLIGCGYKTSL